MNELWYIWTNSIPTPLFFFQVDIMWFHTRTCAMIDIKKVGRLNEYSYSACILLTWITRVYTDQLFWTWTYIVKMPNPGLLTLHN